MKVKEEFHRLIDGIEDEAQLKGYLKLVKSLSDNETGELWNELTDLEKQELLLSYDESFDRKNLVSHKSMKEKHAKWLDQ